MLIPRFKKILFHFPLCLATLRESYFLNMECHNALYKGMIGREGGDGREDG